MSWSEGGSCFQVIERYGDEACRVSVTEAGRARGRVKLRVTVESTHADKACVAEMVRRVRVMLGLNADLSEFHALCKRHPTLHIVPRLGAGRGLRSFDMTENIIKALCATNVTWTQAVKMINRLAQLGPVFPHFVGFNAWPTPREILRAGESYLTEVCRVGYRAETILGFCRSVAAGDFDPGSLDRMAADPDVTSADILAQLRSIHGIGPSSAHYLLGFLGRHDHLSIDSATVAHVARTHFKGRKPTHKQIEAVYAPYGRWKNKAWWYEHWLTWGTAKRLVADAGLDGRIDKKR